MVLARCAPRGGHNLPSVTPGWAKGGLILFIRASCGIDLAVEPEEWQECLVLLRPRCSDLFCALTAHPTYYLALGSWGNVLQALAAFHCKRLRLLRNRLRLRSSHPHPCSLRLGCMIRNCGMDCMHDLVYGGGNCFTMHSFPRLGATHSLARLAGFEAGGIC
jgi:hypothetical protein